MWPGSSGGSSPVSSGAVGLRAGAAPRSELSPCRGSAASLSELLVGIALLTKVWHETRVGFLTSSPVDISVAHSFTSLFHLKGGGVVSL